MKICNPGVYMCSGNVLRILFVSWRAFDLVLQVFDEDLPQQSGSSKKNLQVVDKFRKTCELFLCSKNKRGRMGVQIPCIPFFVRWFTCNLFLCWQAETLSDLLLSKYLLFSFKIMSFSSKHKLHLFYPPVYEIEFFSSDHFMVKSVLLTVIIVLPDDCLLRET